MSVWFCFGHGLEERLLSSLCREAFAIFALSVAPYQTYSMTQNFNDERDQLDGGEATTRK